MFPRLRSLVFVVALVFLLSSPGCKKRVQETKGGPVKADVAALMFPDNVIVFGGVKSLDELQSTLSGVVSKFQPQMAPMVSAQVSALLQGQVLGAKNMTWLDTQKAIRVAVLDYKQFPKPLVLAFQHKGKDQVVAALPDGKSPAGPDNEFKFASPMGFDMFVNFAGDLVVFTMDQKAFAAVKAFVSQDLARYEFSDVIDVQASARNLDRIAGPEIEKMRQEMLEQAADSSPLPIPAVQKLLKEEMALFLKVFRQVEVARLAVRYDGENVVLRGGLKVVDGRKLAAVAASAKDRKLELYKGLPAGGWLVGAGNLDPALFASLSQMGLEFWADILKLEGPEKEKLTSLMRQAVALQTGDMAFRVGEMGDFPLQIVTVTGVKDGVKARDVTLETYGFIFSKFGKFIEQFAGPKPEGMPRLDWSSFKAFSDGLKPVLAQSGLTLNLRSEEVGSVKVDAMDLVVDYAKLPMGHDADAQNVARLFGTRLSMGLGFSKDKAYMLIGKDAVADIAQMEKAQGGGTVISNAITQFGGGMNPIAVVYLSFVDLMKLLSRFTPSINEAMPGLSTASSDFGFTFVAGGHGERVLDAVLAVPVSRIAQLLPKPGAGGAPLTP